MKRSRLPEPLAASGSGSGPGAAAACPFGTETMLPSLLRRRHSALSHERTDKYREQSLRGRQALSRRLGQSLDTRSISVTRQAHVSVTHQSASQSVLRFVRCAWYSVLPISLGLSCLPGRRSLSLWIQAMAHFVSDERSLTVVLGLITANKSIASIALAAVFKRLASANRICERYRYYQCPMASVGVSCKLSV